MIDFTSFAGSFDPSRMNIYVDKRAEDQIPVAKPSNILNAKVSPTFLDIDL